MAERNLCLESCGSLAVGGTVGIQLTYDPDLTAVCTGTERRTRNQSIRSRGGDNQFLCSDRGHVDADTGKDIWPYQEISGRDLGINGPSLDIELATLDVDGGRASVLMEARRTDFFMF